MNTLESDAAAEAAWADYLKSWDDYVIRGDWAVAERRNSQGDS